MQAQHRQVPSAAFMGLRFALTHSTHCEGAEHTMQRCDVYKSHGLWHTAIQKEACLLHRGCCKGTEGTDMHAQKDMESNDE